MYHIRSMRIVFVLFCMVPASIFSADFSEPVFAGMRALVSGATAFCSSYALIKVATETTFNPVLQKVVWQASLGAGALGIAISSSFSISQGYYSRKNSTRSVYTDAVLQGSLIGLFTGISISKIFISSILLPYMKI